MNSNNILEKINIILESIILSDISGSQYKEVLRHTQSMPANYTLSEMIATRNRPVYKQIFGDNNRLWDRIIIEGLEEPVKISKIALNYMKKIRDYYKNLLDLYNKLSNNNEYMYKFDDDISNLKNIMNDWIAGIIKINNKESKKIIKFILAIKLLYKKNNLELNEDDYFNNIQKEYQKRVDFINENNLDKQLNNQDSNVYNICISKSLRDVTAMSTGQGWDSCQNIDHLKEGKTKFDKLNRCLKHDLGLGTCIVFIINDKNLEKSQKKAKNIRFQLKSSTARFLIKPFYSKDESEMYLTCGETPKFYGTLNEKAREQIKDKILKFLEEKQSNISGEFYLPREVYHDPLFNDRPINTIVVKNGKVIKYSYDSNRSMIDEKELFKKYEKLEYQNRIIEQDLYGEWCFTFAKNVEGADIPLLQNSVLKKDNTGEWCYNFAKYIEGANIPLLQEVVLEKDETGEWCYNFAKDIKESNKELLQEAVIKKDKTSKWCCLFAINIRGANTELLQNIVLENDKTGEWSYIFAKNIINSNKELLQQNILKKDKTGKYCYNFAKDIKGADISLLQEEVIKKDKYGEWCYEFAENIREADIEKLENAVINKDNSGLYCYNFAKNIVGFEPELQNAVIEKDKTGEYCYEFARYIKGADRQLLQEAVIDKDETGEWCYKFSKFKNVNKELLLKMAKEKGYE